ncbi:hypothetical protein MKEN_00306200 [Mycena kentingensis (nom. inval.)]|nr:hypothetical protein MKEN_00306200 [Mycena kentingensis (nom. inval.)]
MTRCSFCAISAENGFKVVWEDAEFVAFRDRSPASEHHIQLIPKAHISSVRALRKVDAALVRTMRQIGERLLDELDVSPSMRVFGFHIPPFNSVNHLHLHVQGLPYKPLRGAKYHVTTGFASFGKGFGWFITADQAIRTLERGRSIGVLPC